MPGDYSNELAATPLGGSVESPAAGFTEGVLGTQDANDGETASTAAPQASSQHAFNLLEAIGNFFASALNFIIGLLK